MTVDGQARRRGRAADEAGIRVRVRSRHRHAGLADRGAARAARATSPASSAWPTQPFPTKPAALAPQGVSLDDAFDLTPALKAQAQAETEEDTASDRCTRRRRRRRYADASPGVIGGANWGGGAFDPETGMLYVKTSNQPALARIRRRRIDPTTNPRAGEVDAEFVGDPAAARRSRRRRLAGGAGERRPAAGAAAVKPPYGELVAIDLGARRDRLARAVRRHAGGAQCIPLLQDVTLPERLGVAGAPGVIVTKGGLVLRRRRRHGALRVRQGDGPGSVRASTCRGGRPGTPMTYRTQSGRSSSSWRPGLARTRSLVAWG